MTADHRQLQQLFLTLFLNALDAMPAGGVLGVRTSVAEGPRTIRVEISNTGGGNDTGAKGTGLALSIANLLVERHGGTIAAVRIPDDGTVLTVRMPVRPPGEPPAS
jgi:signal transduction histidine kinase